MGSDLLHEVSAIRTDDLEELRRMIRDTGERLDSYGRDVTPTHYAAHQDKVTGARRCRPLRQDCEQEQYEAPLEPLPGDPAQHQLAPEHH